jgi:hypothetical protein
VYESVKIRVQQDGENRMSDTKEKYYDLCKRLHFHEEDGNKISDAVDELWQQMTERENANDWETVEKVLPTFAEIVELEMGDDQ